MEKANTRSYRVCILLLLLHIKELWIQCTQIAKAALMVVGIAGVFGVGVPYVMWLLTFPVPFGAIIFYGTIAILSILAWHYNPKSRA